MNSGYKWTDKELEILKARVKDGFSDEEISMELGRTKSAIQQKRNEKRYRKDNYGLPAPARRRRPVLPKVTVSLFWGLIKFTKR